jgi:hypothetical protein
MNPEQDVDVENSGSGLSGVLKSIGILGVLLLAALAVLLVLDLLPRDAAGEAVMKAMLVLGIVAVASVVIAALSRGRRR